MRFIFKGMRSVFTIFFFLSGVCFVNAQNSCKTIVTGDPIVAGESFQVQYVVQATTGEIEFIPPAFAVFHVISGPYTYQEAKTSADGRYMKNIVYTLAALQPGKFTIPGASVRIDDKMVKSDPVFIRVISKEAAAQKKRAPDRQLNMDYLLQPGEDPYAKMKKNLFMQVAVDKKSCYVGESVTAIFKLYSRLESRSDIVKNPGFYGFSIRDVVTLKDKVTTSEMIDGKQFDVHTIRKVQLYPFQSGSYSIDPMEVVNKVEFTTSADRKPVRQEIVEGVVTVNNADEVLPTVTYENTMHTQAIAINVKPLPEKNRPDSFNGAVGRFSMNVEVTDKEAAIEEGATLDVVIKGEGNFTQLSAPLIEWPKGIEVFEPEIKDEWKTERSALQGQRRFRFRFIAAHPGLYTLPAIQFSFFNPDSNRYITLTQQLQPISFVKGRAPLLQEEGLKKKPATSGKGITGVIAVVLGTVLALAGYYTWQRAKRKREKKAALITTVTQLPTAADLLSSIKNSGEKDATAFYTALRHSIWQFAAIHLPLAGSNMSKAMFKKELELKAIPQQEITALFSIVDECETGIFTNVLPATERENLLARAGELLSSIEKKITGYSEYL